MDKPDAGQPGYHLRRVVDRVSSMLAYWDRELRCRFANRAYETWFGVDPDQLIGTSLRDLLGPELFALNEPYVMAALRGEPQTFERIVPGPDGVRRHSLANYEPDIVDGEVVGFTVTVTEVTQLKQTEANLRSAIKTLEDEIRLRKMIEDRLVDIQQSLAITLASIDAGFIATDRQGRVTLMNAVSERLTGWRQTEAHGRPLFEVFVRDGRPTEVLQSNPVDWVAEQGLTVEDVHHVVAIAQDGRRTPVEVKVALTFGDDGQERGLAIVLRDRTQELRAEAESNMLAAIVESSEDAIIGKTLDGRITSWNSAAQRLYGYSAEEAIGRPVQMLIPVDRVDEEMRILANLAHGMPVPAFDTVRRTKDGRLVEVSLAISPIRDAEGRIAGASKIARDISQRKQAEQARLKAERLEAENRQIVEANRLKSQFLASMSHELRTPLNAIIGFAELLQSGKVPAESAKHQSFLGHIGSSGRHLLQLINDVLDLAKVESGKFEFFPEPLDLSRLVGEAGDILHSGLERKRIDFRIEIEPQVNDLVLDPARLKQVLYNYLSNAIKFTPTGGRITVRARAAGSRHFRFEVEDNGVGVAPDDIPRLFSEFAQLEAGRVKQHQGTGLGLALTRRLVEAQGGSVGVTSEPGRGSIFHAILNRVHGTDTAPEQDRLPSEVEARTQRVLVIEDDEQLQTRLVEGLSAAGLEVAAAGSGGQAVNLAERTRFDGLTLDLILPDHMGLSLLADLRREEQLRHAQVMGVTMPAHDGGSAAFAIADILGKPLRAGELVAAMERLKRSAGVSTCVMVVDDDPLALDLMRETLAAMEVRALCYQDGRHALSELDQHRPDAIVLDLMMPEFDGFAMLDALHRTPAWRHTPVFIWTSLILTAEEYTALSHSARAIVSKGGGDLAVMLERLKQTLQSAAT